MSKTRLKFHLMPPQGWMNDPNGLSYFAGNYHVFFQYTPDTPLGGNKWWGHYQGKTLTDLEFVGVPLAPDTPWDRDGVYSGSAIVKDQELWAYYTGNVLEEGGTDYILEGRGANVILVKSRDGVNFNAKKCVLTNSDYPEDVSCHVRDPKVFARDGKYYMVLGARTRADKGILLFYESEDGEIWEYSYRVSTEKPFGYMWECPDVFTWEGQEIVSLSPQGVPREELRYQNLYLSGYFLPEKSVFEGGSLDVFYEWDYGFDFYAPQTFLDPQGRRILIGWMGLPGVEEEYNNRPTIEEGWQHALTVPREVTIREGKVCNYPIQEFTKLRGEEVTCERAPECWDCEIKNIQGEFQLDFGNGIHLIFENSVLRMKLEVNCGWGRIGRKVSVKEIRELRILQDTTCVELFVNHGEIAMTSRVYPGKHEPLIWKGNPADIKMWEM